jgi:conjugal transfer pilus assembly protein TraV
MRPKNQPSALWLALLGTGILSGCQVLVPYDNEFACAKSHDYGKCMDVQSAYEDARANAGSAPTATPAAAKSKSGARSAPAKSPPGTAEMRGELVREAFAPVDGDERVREARYRELAGLIENPVTPLIQPARVLRTLIVSYSAGDALYMPRYVYYIAEDAKFVLGDYLQDSPAERTMYPNGGPAVPR